MRRQEPNVFPYSLDGVVAPRTDGLISGGEDPKTSVFIGFPAGDIATPPKNKGRIIPGYMGDTDCVDTNNIWHPVFAGDS